MINPAPLEEEEEDLEGEGGWGEGEEGRPGPLCPLYTIVLSIVLSFVTYPFGRMGGSGGGNHENPNASSTSRLQRHGRRHGRCVSGFELYRRKLRTKAKPPGLDNGVQMHQRLVLS